MTQEGLINVFKYIVKKCDKLINNDNYEADAYTQCTVEDIAELCNHILDGDYGKLVEDKTDAFMEKACVRLKKLMYDNLMFQGRLHREEVIDNFVEDFKEYMKGE